MVSLEHTQDSTPNDKVDSSIPTDVIEIPDDEEEVVTPPLPILQEPIPPPIREQLITSPQLPDSSPPSYSSLFPSHDRFPIRTRSHTTQVQNIQRNPFLSEETESSLDPEALRRATRRATNPNWKRIRSKRRIPNW